MADAKYKDKVFKGSVFPGQPVSDKLKVVFSPEMMSEYIPTIEKMKIPAGLKLLCTVIASQEGFTKKSRSYRTHNPGNIGNTDSGKNKAIATLADGIKLQSDFISNIVTGSNKNFPIGKQVDIKPYYSPEIAKNQRIYGLSPYLPGYSFLFTGQLDQFIKIYSTGARATNSYLSLIVSYFAIKGLPISAQTTLGEISKMA